jgi:hypothetical protein
MLTAHRSQELADKRRLFSLFAALTYDVKSQKMPVWVFDKWQLYPDKGLLNSAVTHAAFVKSAFHLAHIFFVRKSECEKGKSAARYGSLRVEHQYNRRAAAGMLDRPAQHPLTILERKIPFVAQQVCVPRQRTVYIPNGKSNVVGAAKGRQSSIHPVSFNPGKPKF